MRDRDILENNRELPFLITRRSYIIVSGRG